MNLRPTHLAVLTLLAACGSVPSTSASTSASGRPFRIAEVATFDSPWAMTFLPGLGLRMTNAALVTEKPGRIWLVDTATGSKRPVGGVPKVVLSGQGGLLDIKASPDFAGNRQVYFTFAEPSANGGSTLALARAQLEIAAGADRLTNVRVVWRDPAGGEGGQFGGIIAFAPDGESLFLSSGERQRFTPAQDPSQPLGKTLHLTLDGEAASPGPSADERLGAATVMVTDPPRDTEAAKTAKGRVIRWPGVNRTPAQTWTSGHRNPYGLAFDDAGRLWETEMGPRGGDELNLIVQGKNYGWPLVSEGENYNGVAIARHSSRPEFSPPKLAWTPSVSPTTLMFYRGELFPQWKGSAFIATLSGQSLIRVTFQGETAAKADQWDMGQRIRWVGEGPEGAIYLLEDGGRMLRLTPAAPTR